MSDEYVLLCYRGACQAAAHPACWNRITGGVYCETCAITIDGHREPGDPSLFPLLPYTHRVSENFTGSWGEQILIRPPKPRPAALRDPLPDFRDTPVKMRRGET